MCGAPWESRAAEKTAENNLARVAFLPDVREEGDKWAFAPVCGAKPTSRPGTASGSRHQLLAHLLGRVDHVAQAGFDLSPGACLEAAVGVDPELLGTQDTSSLVEQLDHLVRARDPRGVDVVDPRADVVRVPGPLPVV